MTDSENRDAFIANAKPRTLMDLQGMLKRENSTVPPEAAMARIGVTESPSTGLAAALSNVGTMSPRLRKLYDDAAALLRAQAAGPVPARELARQVFALCEWFEELPDGAQDSQEVERFKAGQRFAAKRIRNTIGTWLTDEENTRRAAGA